GGFGLNARSGPQPGTKGEKQAERNEEPGVPPGEGGSSHPLEEAKPPEVAYDPAEEDGRECPRAGDEWPARQGGAPERESTQTTTRAHSRLRISLIPCARRGSGLFLGGKKPRRRGRPGAAAARV